MTSKQPDPSKADYLRLRLMCKPCQARGYRNSLAGYAARIYPQRVSQAEEADYELAAFVREPLAPGDGLADLQRAAIDETEEDAYLGADDPDLTDEDSLCRDDQYYAQAELESEANAAYDDQQERYAREALDPEYEAFCDDQQDEDDPSWSDQAAEDEFIESQQTHTRGGVGFEDTSGA